MGAAPPSEVAEFAVHRRIRMGLQPSPRPVALLVPALRKGLAGASEPRLDRRPTSAVHQVLCEVLDKVESKSNEIAAMPSVLDISDLFSRKVKADALCNRQGVSARIVDKVG